MAEKKVPSEITAEVAPENNYSGRSFADLMTEYESFLAKGETAPIELTQSILGYNSEVTDKNIKRQLGLYERLTKLAKKSPEIAMDGLMRLRRTRHKLLKLALTSTFMVVAGLTANYEKTRYKVNSTEDPVTHEKRYEHEDPKTTHYLNCLAGLEKLTPDEETQLLRELIRNKTTIEALKEKEALDKNADASVLEEASREELISIWKKYNARVGDPVLAVNDQDFLDDTFGIYPYNFDQKYYEALWKMEEENGSPKLSFKYPLSYERSNYGWLNNEVRLQPQGSNTKTKNVLIAELAHGKQFNESPVTSYFRGIRDSGSIIQYLAFAQSELYDKGISEEKPEYTYKRFQKIYDRQLYREPGSPWINEKGQTLTYFDQPQVLDLTLEYDAHNKIEPGLRERFEELYPHELAEASEDAKKAKKLIQVESLKLEGKAKLEPLIKEYNALKRIISQTTEEIELSKKIPGHQKPERVDNEWKKLAPYTEQIESIIEEYRLKGVDLGYI